VLTQFTGTHGTTFGGSPLACAMGHHVLTRLSSPVFRSQMEDVSRYLGERLLKLPEWYPEIVESIRGRGFIRGVGFKDRGVPGKIVELARERGVFVLSAGSDAVRLVPSLTVGKEEVDLAVDVLESCLHRIT
jgi:acetylornithine aminotransferase